MNVRHRVPSDLRRNVFIATESYPYGLTRSEFRRLPKAIKHEVMIEWFNEHYEDPVHRTPYESAEGGYQWIWGGPYDAAEELGDMFGGLVSDELIEEAVAEIEADGQTEWTSADSSDDYDDRASPDEQQNELVALEDLLSGVPDRPGPAYQTEDERSLRQTAIDALGRVEETLASPRSVGMGHNRPPGSIVDDEKPEADAPRSIAAELRTELEKVNPQISVVKALAVRLGRAIGAMGRWMGDKIDIFATEAAKSAGKKFGATIGLVPIALEPHVQAAISTAIETVSNWLHLATLPF